MLPPGRFGAPSYGESWMSHGNKMANQGPFKEMVLYGALIIYFDNVFEINT